MKCKDCKDKQYCRDCKEEQKKEKILLKGFAKNPKPLPPISINGQNLHFKGRNFTISDIEVRNPKEPQSPNKKIKTKEGFIFYVRERNQENILIKVRKVRKTKKGKPDFCESCYDLLIGIKLPKEFLKDTNW